MFRRVLSSAVLATTISFGGVITIGADFQPQTSYQSERALAAELYHLRVLHSLFDVKYDKVDEHKASVQSVFAQLDAVRPKIFAFLANASRRATDKRRPNQRASSYG